MIISTQSIIEDLITCLRENCRDTILYQEMWSLWLLIEMSFRYSKIYSLICKIKKFYMIGIHFCSIGHFHAIKSHFTKITISGLQAAELMLRNVFFWMCLTEVNCLQEAKSSFLYNFQHSITHLYLSPKSP